MTRTIPIGGCPACHLADVPTDRLYLMGVVVGMVIQSYGDVDKGIGNAKWCARHHNELATLARSALAVLKPRSGS